MTRAGATAAPAPFPEPAGREPIFASVSVSGDRVDAAVAGRAIDPRAVGLGEFVAVADALSARAAGLLAAGGETSVLVDVAASWVAAPKAGPLRAEAVLVARQPDCFHWRVTLTAGGEVVGHALAKRRAPAEPPLPNKCDVGVRGPPPPAPMPSIPEPKLSANAEAQRERIAAAAADVIAAKGFSQATMREIAEAAGLHVPTLYTYVASKDDLLELVYLRSMDHILVDVDEATRSCRTFREKVATVVRAILARTDANRRRIGVLNREFRSLSPGARARVLERYRTMLERIAAIVRGGVEAGEFRPTSPLIVANLIDAACDMRALRPFMFDQVPLEAFQDDLLALVDRALCGAGAGNAAAEAGQARRRGAVRPLRQA